MDIIPLGPGFAAELRGVTLADVAADDAAYAAVRAAFEEHSVLVFRDQTGDRRRPARFLTPLRSTRGHQGRLARHRHAFRHPHDDRCLTAKSCRRITVTPCATRPISSGIPTVRSRACRRWPRCSSARTIPARGGETEYVSTRLAFERLDPALRRKLENLFAWHSYAHSRGKIADGLATPEEVAALPPVCWRMVWKNPANGRSALYIASHTYAIEGMEPAAASKLIDELTAAATAPGTTYEHKWRNGDVVMWDNRATMHRGRPWPANEPRYMVRTTISATAADGVEAMRPPPRVAAE